jgi:hypothetical protein
MWFQKKFTKLPIWQLGFMMLPLLALGLAQQNISFHLGFEFARIWTDEAMKDWELPNSNPEFSAQPVSEEFYYNLPERVIYKTYPVYHPDHEPEGYWEWLHEQEAESYSMKAN